MHFYDILPYVDRGDESNENSRGYDLNLIHVSSAQKSPLSYVFHLGRGPH